MYHFSPFVLKGLLFKGVVELYKLPISNRISSDADQLVSACSNEIVYSSRMADSTSTAALMNPTTILPLKQTF